MENGLWEQKTERLFNIFAFATACIMLIVTVFGITREYSSKERIEMSYRAAVELEERGDYWNAYKAYLEAGDYNNSDIKAEILYPKAAMSYGRTLYYSDQKYNAIPYLIDAANEGIDEAEELLMQLIQDYLVEKEE